MDKKDDSFYKVLNTVGPIDCIFRAFIGLIILVVAYSLDPPIYDFALMHLATTYLWVSALTGWDPFYSIAKRIWSDAKESLAINGRFKI